MSFEIAFSEMLINEPSESFFLHSNRVFSFVLIEMSGGSSKGKGVGAGRGKGERKGKETPFVYEGSLGPDF